MEKQQYYTPELWEFCEGFEVEILNKSDNWQKWKVDVMKGEIEWLIDTKFSNLIRVKCLDHKDIESLGFVFVKAFIRTPQIKYWGKDFTLWANFETEKFVFVSKEGITKYHGKIRNKFHLQQILKDIC